MEIILRDVRLSHPDLWVPTKPPNSNNEPKFGCHGIFGEDDPLINYSPKGKPERLSNACQEIMGVFNKVCQDKWGQNWANIVKAIDKDKKCVRVGDMALDKKGNVKNGYEGKLYVSARNKLQPKIIAHRFFNGKPVYITKDGGAEIEDGNKMVKVSDLPFKLVVPYAGCYVNLKIDVYAADKNGNMVGAQLLTVQFSRDGEAFGGGTPNADGFEGYEGDDAEEAFGSAPAAGGADDLFGGDAPAAQSTDNLFG